MFKVKHWSERLRGSYRHVKVMSLIRSFDVQVARKSVPVPLILSGVRPDDTCQVMVLFAGSEEPKHLQPRFSISDGEDSKMASMLSIILTEEYTVLQ
jgi:hypothetical protein